jgi:hypothetical protein
VTVEAEFVPGPQGDEQETGHAHGQARDVDQRIALVILEISESDFHVVSEHDAPPGESLQSKCGQNEKEFEGPDQAG